MRSMPSTSGCTRVSASIAPASWLIGASAAVTGASSWLGRSCCSWACNAWSGAGSGSSSQSSTASRASSRPWRTASTWATSWAGSSASSCRRTAANTSRTCSASVARRDRLHLCDQPAVDARHQPDQRRRVERQEQVLGRGGELLQQRGDDSVAEPDQELAGLVEQRVHLVADRGGIEGAERAEQPRPVEPGADERWQELLDRAPPPRRRRCAAPTGRRRRRRPAIRRRPPSPGRCWRRGEGGRAWGANR